MIFWFPYKTDVPAFPRTKANFSQVVCRQRQQKSCEDCPLWAITVARCTRLRHTANAREMELLAYYGASRHCWKKLSTSVVVVKRKLRRLSSVGRHDVTKATGVNAGGPFSLKIPNRQVTGNRSHTGQCRLCIRFVLGTHTS